MHPVKNNFKQHLLSSVYSAALALLLCSAAAICAAEPTYLAAGHPDATIFLAPPPALGSPEQAADLAETVAVHQAFSGEKSDKDWSKKKLLHFILSNTNEAAYQADKFPKTEAFFKQVGKETGDVVGTAKDYWKRSRPYTTKPDLIPGGKDEGSFGYPSGHSTGGMVTALLLAELYPDREKEILAIGREIGWHRVELANHYPTDVVAGRVLAQAIVRELKNSPDFQRDFAAVKKEIPPAPKAACGI
jgi:acid phosphatase (class A)